MKNPKNKKRLIQVATENEKIVRDGFYLVDGFKIDISSSIIQSLVDTFTVTPPPLQEEIEFECDNSNTIIDVVHQGTVDGAQELSDFYKKSPLLLNFASAKTPGGGYVRGTVAQEEDLCRCSSLFFSLKKEDSFYKLYDGISHLYSDSFIYSKKVPFFRNEDFSFKERPFTASVITYAAPNLSKEDIDPETVKETFEKRIENILNFSLFMGYREIVLGAWGCGVFANDPDMVASVFAKLIYGKYKDKFSHIRFSVFDKTKEQKVLQTFKEYFQKEL